MMNIVEGHPQQFEDIVLAQTVTYFLLNESEMKTICFKKKT